MGRAIKTTATSPQRHARPWERRAGFWTGYFFNGVTEWGYIKTIKPAVDAQRRRVAYKIQSHHLL